MQLELAGVTVSQVSGPLRPLQFDKCLHTID